MICDGERMEWVTNRSGTMEALTVEPGVHVLGNYGLDNEKDAVVATLHEELRDAAGWERGAARGAAARVAGDARRRAAVRALQ
jgi:hypothetical protein